MYPRRTSTDRYCPVCLGTGQREQRTVCPACHGNGHVNLKSSTLNSGSYRTLQQDGALRSFLRTAIETSSADSGNIQLYNVSDHTLRIVEQEGFGKEFLRFFDVVQGSESACGTAMNSGSRVIVSDVASDPIFRGTPAGKVMLRANALAVQSTPLVSSTGLLLGMLSTHHRQPRTFSAAELGWLDQITQRLASSLESQLRAI